MPEKKEADLAGTAKTNDAKQPYRNSTPPSSVNLIAECRAAMPEIYRRQYDKAMGGKSLRAAVNSKCLDCCCWERTAVRDCSAIACPLHTVRPYQASSKKNRPVEQGFSDCEGDQDE